VRIRVNFKPKKGGSSGANDHADYGFDDFRSDYLGEYKARYETVLACKSYIYLGLIDEKNRGSKISCNCPYNALFFLYPKQSCIRKSHLL
jgi:hypothetical protein